MNTEQFNNRGKLNAGRIKLQLANYFLKSNSNKVICFIAKQK